MFKKLKKFGSVLTNASRNRVRFMQSRMEEMSTGMQSASTNIDIALDNFTQRIDIKLTHYNARLNKIMLLLTLVTIIFTPASVIAGIMGMNVFVPGQAV